MLDRLLEAGWRPGDQVIVAAAGTRHPHAHREVGAAAAMLSALVGSRVFIGFAAPCRDGSGYPSVPDAVDRARRTVQAGWPWRHTCWRRAYFRVGCARWAPTWWLRRWACIRP